MAPRIFKESAGYRPSGLLESARDHMAASRLLFDAGPFAFDSAGYLAHLGVELGLKALLLAMTDEFPAEHNLQTLRRLVAEAHQPGLEFTAEGERILVVLDEFEQLRYPQPSKPIEIGSDDVEPIFRLFANLWDALPDPLKPVPGPSGFVTKGGRTLMRRPVDDND